MCVLFNLIRLQWLTFDWTHVCEDKIDDGFVANVFCFNSDMVIVLWLNFVKFRYSNESFADTLNLDPFIKLLHT